MAAADGSQAGLSRNSGEAADGDGGGTPGWVWAIVVLLLLGAAAAGAVYHRQGSKARALNSLFQDGGAQSRSLSIAPGRSAAAANPDSENGNIFGTPVYENPTYAAPVDGIARAAGTAGPAVTPVYHVSGTFDETDNAADYTTD